MSSRKVAVVSNYWSGDVEFWTSFDPYNSATYEKFCGQVAGEARKQKGANVYWQNLVGNGVLNVTILAQTKEDDADKGRNVAAPREEPPEGWKPASDGDGFEPKGPYYEAGGVETYRHRRTG